MAGGAASSSSNTVFVESASGIAEGARTGLASVETRRVVLVGAVLWALGLVVVLLLGDRVDRVWTWTCLCGLVLAVLGLALMRWQGQR